LKISRSTFAPFGRLFGTNQRRTTPESVAGAQSQENSANTEAKEALKRNEGEPSLPSYDLFKHTSLYGDRNR
jgi:hypothetical protein